MKPPLPTTFLQLLLENRYLRDLRAFRWRTLDPAGVRLGIRRRDRRALTGKNLALSDCATCALLFKNGE